MYYKPSYDINTTIILFLLFKLAQEQILLLVRKVGDEHKWDAGLVKILFENGVIGVDDEAEKGDSGCNFKLN